MTSSLRIAHVLPYASVDGSFGGPVAVAVEQCRELARQGHTVVLVAGWDGELDLHVEGVCVRLFRARPIPGAGFSGLLSPQLTMWLRRHVRDFDVVHIHLGRHLLALTAADISRKAGVPYVLQTHGMVIEDGRLRSRVLDHVSVRRVLRHARSVLALTDSERRSLEVVSRGAILVSRIRNGVTVRTQVTRLFDEDRIPEVLFLARLHPRKRVMAFAEMASLVSQRGIRARFTVVGPDEGDLPILRAFIDRNPDISLVHEGSVPPGMSVGRLALADVYVLPSVREVFPMTVLEAMSVGTPVVLTEDCGLSSELHASGAALITDGSAGGLAEAVERVLLSAETRELLANGMRNSLESDFGIAAVARDLIQVYPESDESA